MDESADSVTAIVTVNSIASSSRSDLASPVATVLATDTQILPTTMTQKAVATRKTRQAAKAADTQILPTIVTQKAVATHKTRQAAKSATISAAVTPVLTETVTPEPSSPQLTLGGGNLDASGTEQVTFSFFHVKNVLLNVAVIQTARAFAQTRLLSR
jgi:hypothetical protein